MTRRLTLSFLTATLLSLPVATANESAALGQSLSKTYSAWHKAMVTKNARQWQQLTASHRRMEVRNRIVSEKKPFPAAIFDLPVPPPSLNGLRIMNVSQVGPTAKVGYYGPVDFGVGGKPTNNVLMLSFVSEKGRWLYDKADFVNLNALPEVRKELDAGNPKYIRDNPESRASGSIPPTAMAMPPAKYIAKVYAFCPGREVQVQVNRISRHKFTNTKEAEIVMGGARDGRNEVTFTTRGIEGATGKEALAVRVYLMSEVPGTKPIIAYEFVAKEGELVKPIQSGSFNLDRATAKRLTGR